MLQASRSHLDKGVYDIYFPTFSDDERLALLADMADCSPDAGSVCCWDGFLVAEVNGTPAAALAGYGSDTKSTQGYLDTMWDALKRRGWTRDQFERMLEKREAIDSVTTKDSRRLWVVDWVTTLPEFRKLGLISKLLHLILQRGKERGYKLAEVSVFLGNDPAILAYKKKGFEEYQSIASPVWQRVINCPGIMRLVKPLNDNDPGAAPTQPSAESRL